MAQLPAHSTTDDPAPKPPREGPRVALVAIPLRRPAVAAFLRDWRIPARGTSVRVVEQRPPAPVRDAWLDGLAALDDDEASHEVLVERVLATDPAAAHMGTTTTDRLVPRHFLDQDDTFLERNLGGWSPVWLGPLAVVGDPDRDPVLAAAERLADHGHVVESALAPSALVRDRLPVEFDTGVAHLPRGAAVLRQRRAARDPDGSGPGTSDVLGLLDELVAAVAGAGPLSDDVHPLLAHDEVLEQLVRLELARRSATAEGDDDRARSLADRQREVDDRWGLRLLLKGEYLLGRHRRSTVLLAEGAGVVVKQPAPEPRHTIDLASRTVDGLDENWPRALGDGAMVTPRRALSDVVASGAVERLDEAFGREVRYSTALGLSIEPFAEGPTLADLAVRRPAELTAARYDEVLVHQLACEALEVDNPDWHAANFLVTGAGLVHVDWGAARPIAPDHRGPDQARSRLDQVRELAWSFQDEALGARVVDLHERATTDAEHLDGLRRRARDLVDGA